MRNRHFQDVSWLHPAVLSDLEANRQIVFRYCDADGQVVDTKNPNGSVNAIAGLCNPNRNVVALMPHPERACESMLGSADGLVLFESVVMDLGRDGMLKTG